MTAEPAVVGFSCLWNSLQKDPVRRDYCEDTSSRSFFVCFFGDLSVSFGVSLLHTCWSAHTGHSLCLGCNFLISCIFFFESSQKKILTLIFFAFFLWFATSSSSCTFSSSFISSSLRRSAQCIMGTVLSAQAYCSIIKDWFRLL